MMRFDGLTAGYGGEERLHGISCTFPKGRLTALIGPNGCGKTTLLKCAAGIMKPSSGQILLDNAPYFSISRRERARRVACMPQSRPTPEMTVQQLAACGRYPHLGWGKSMSDVDKQIVAEALVRAGADRFANRSVFELSGGERQRAYLAMMLAQQASVLLLDEPTTYLDPGSQFELMELLLSLRSENRTVVAALHDLSLAMEYADHIILMQDGRLVQSGSPEEIFASGLLGEVFGVKAERIHGRYVFRGI